MQGTSAEGDPHSNGAPESSVNVVKGYVRSIKLAVESASGVEVSADHDLLTWLVSYATSMNRRFSVGRDGKRQHTKEMWEGVLFTLWHNSASECGGCLCSHPTIVWVLSIHDLSKVGTWDRWMDQSQCLLALRVVW